ncbi:hypothetical protein TD95_000900 [Thielaviopsis punctulata]|uniref:Uncharacterized protein n=1 Tax=Thielaviopsis punctulata TaxID=72032 RepID=A0A0F4ZEN9_9PEZI|nr:hypothetical protein TD95_000900 [Thielaviopsis punctulata]
MGVTGLLGLLKSIQHPGDLKRYSGKTLGVDTYGWLHKGVISCASQLALNKPTKRYVEYCIYRIRMLQHYNITPYLVFDGDFLPSKAKTEALRQEKREASKKRGLEFLKAGKTKQADEEFQKCIDVTPEMARNVIDEIKKLGIAYVVAPYEADSQLVYLEKKGIIHGILSEDSDLLVFGAKRLITKLDRHGSCVEINRSEFCRVREVSLTGWTDADFRRMCILNGCDYLEGIGGIGLKSAYRLIRTYKTPEKVVQMLQFEGKYKVSENYLSEFTKAELTFIHQRVYCPVKKEMVLLTEDDTGAADGMMFIGSYIEPEIMRRIAAGDVNPITKKPMVGAQISPKKRGVSDAIQATPAPSANPITAYFGSRIPMGEMDSNCFTVDPEEVAELTNHGLAPRVFPLPRPYIDGITTPKNRNPRLRRKTEPIQDMLNSLSTSMTPSASPGLRTRSTPARHSIGSTVPGYALSSQLRPSKKARLCDDDSFIDEDSIAETPVRQISKFFPASTTKSTVSTTTATPASTKNAKDVAAGILETLPDLDEWHSPQKSRRNSMFKVFGDLGKPIKDELHGVTTDNGMSKNISPSAKHVLKTGASASPLTSAKSTDVAKAPKRTSLSQFMYQSGNQPLRRSNSATNLASDSSQSLSRRSSNISSTPPLVSSTASSVSSSASSIANPSSSVPRMTPLQRMGFRALGSAIAGSPVPHKPVVKSLTKTKKLSKSASMGSLKKPFWETQPISSLPSKHKSADENGKAIKDILKDETAQNILKNMQGSEEMLPFIEADDVDETASAAATPFNLSHFAYEQ